MKLPLVFILIFCFSVTSAMELAFVQQSSPAFARSQDYFDVLPKDIKAQILAELYCSAGNKYVLRFLRTSKKYYGDPDLTYKLIYTMTHDFQGNRGERVMQIALDLGTPHAVSFLREYYKTNPAALACPNEHFFYQARDNNYRVSRILKLAGVDINAYRDASGDNAFLAARHIEYYEDLPAKLRYLLYLGADINSMDRSGNNLLAYLIFDCRDFSEQYFFLSAKLLIGQGINFNQQNKAGKSAFSYATRFGFHKVVRLMQQQEEKKVMVS